MKLRSLGLKIAVQLCNVRMCASTYHMVSPSQLREQQLHVPIQAFLPQLFDCMQGYLDQSGKTLESGDSDPASLILAHKSLLRCLVILNRLGDNHLGQELILGHYGSQTDPEHDAEFPR